jgi:hypothetical protein
MACENAAVTTHGMKPYELLHKKKLYDGEKFSHVTWSLMCHQAAQGMVSRADKVKAKHSSVKNTASVNC